MVDKEIKWFKWKFPIIQMEEIGQAGAERLSVTLKAMVIYSYVE